MNIYQMYVNNGNKAGFRVRRDSWARTRTALILSVDGKSSGKLKGRPPYYGDPPVIGDLDGVGEIKISCPGSYTYTLLEGDFSSDFVTTSDYAKPSLLPVVGLLVVGRVIGCDELGVKYFKDPDLWSSGVWEDWEGQP